MKKIPAVLAVAVAAFALFFFAAAGAAEPPEFADPAQTQRYRQIISELRCLVCQNQNLADSNADLARDMRGAVAQMVRDGESDRAVADFMTARYGDFVLYRPPFKPSTWLLWLAPAALLLAGLLAVAMLIRRPRRADVGEKEKQQAEKILDGAEGE